MSFLTKHRVVGVTGAVAGLLAFGTLTATPASAHTSGDRWQGEQSGRCLDVPQTANGTRANLYDCWGGWPQTWQWSATGELKVDTGKCLDAYGHGKTNGTPVVVWDCTGGNNQKWDRYSDGTIRNRDSGLCLDAPGTSNGTPLHLWACWGGANQKWWKW